MTSKTQETINKIAKVVDMLFQSAGWSNMKWSLFMWQDDPNGNAKPIGQRVNYTSNCLREDVLVSIEAVAHRWREQNIRPSEETATATIHAFITAAQRLRDGELGSCEAYAILPSTKADFENFLEHLKKVEAITGVKS